MIFLLQLTAGLSHLKTKQTSLAISTLTWPGLLAPLITIYLILTVSTKVLAETCIALNFEPSDYTWQVVEGTRTEILFFRIKLDM